MWSKEILWDQNANNTKFLMSQEHELEVVIFVSLFFSALYKLRLDLTEQKEELGVFLT